MKSNKETAQLKSGTKPLAAKEEATSAKNKRPARADSKAEASAKGSEAPRNAIVASIKAHWNEPKAILKDLRALSNKEDSEVKSENLSTEIMKLIFAILGYSDKNYLKNLVETVKTKSALTQFVMNWYLKQPMTKESTKQHLKILFEELKDMISDKVKIGYDDFAKNVTKFLKSSDAARNSVVDEILASLESREHLEGEIIENGQAALGDIELESLEDEETMNRLDRALGKMFAKGDVPSEALVAVSSLLTTMEAIMKNASEIEDKYLVPALYFCQCEQLHGQVRFIVKEILKKQSNPEKTFDTYVGASLQIPEVHCMHNLFVTASKGNVDYSQLLEIVFRAGAEMHIVNRIDLDEFYKFYKPGVSEEQDECYNTILLREARRDVLTELMEKEERADIKEGLKKRLSVLAKKQKRKNRRKNKKENELKNGALKSEDKDESQGSGNVKVKLQGSNEPKEAKLDETVSKSKGIVSKSDEIASKSRGISINPKGIDAKPKGISVNPKGIDVNPKGIDVNPKGISINPKGIDVKLKKAPQEKARFAEETESDNDESEDSTSDKTTGLGRKATKFEKKIGKRIFEKKEENKKLFRHKGKEDSSKAAPEKEEPQSVKRVDYKKKGESKAAYENKREERGSSRRSDEHAKRGERGIKNGAPKESDKRAAVKVMLEGKRPERFNGNGKRKESGRREDRKRARH